MIMARKHRSTAAPVEAQAWFAPKRYGYGAGLPLAWQGWAATLAYVLLVTGAAFGILPRSVPAFVAIIFGATAVFLLIVYRTTRGGWRWRWGERPEAGISAGRCPSAAGQRRADGPVSRHAD